MSLAIMARLVFGLLALYAASAFASSNVVEKSKLAERQAEILDLFQHINEPASSPLLKYKATKFYKNDKIEDKFGNATAVKTYFGMMDNGWLLPRSVPFSINEPAHAFEAITLFNTLYSAKEYETFYFVAATLRDVVNEGLFVYVVSSVIFYRQDTQGIALPPQYEIFPSLFFNGEVIATANRINIHGYRNANYYPSTYVSGESVVIKENATEWAYFGKNPLSYFTNDPDLNNAQYFLSLVTPFWLGNKLAPGVLYKERRGEAWWFAYRQLVARYYLELLSNDLSVIPEITTEIVQGFSSGLVYSNGVPFPSRPDNYRLDQPQLASAVEKVLEYERRILEAIDKGFFVDREGKQVSLLTDAGLETLARLIESNADSPNRYYYKDFIRIWKQILGNSIKPGYEYNNYFSPLVVPSALENYQTALRDPVFYSLVKRVLNLFVQWQKQMPLYKPEELTLPNVEIESIEVDKLVTFFEYKSINITSSLYHNEHEVKEVFENTIVLVEQKSLNHKPFSVNLKIKSDAAKKVKVTLFLAPKYDSKGFEIPLQLNTENFFMLDEFLSDLSAGESVVSRKSTDFLYTSKKVATTTELVEEILEGNFTAKVKSMSVFPHNLVLPKGAVGGKTFQLVAYIQTFDGFKQPYSAGFRPLGFPADRPLYKFQVAKVANLKFQDVKIFHEE